MKTPFKNNWFPACPRCFEEEADGVEFEEMPLVTVHDFGYICEKHGTILNKDMKPNNKTCEMLNTKWFYIWLYFSHRFFYALKRTRRKFFATFQKREFVFAL
jgi:hypothetical protein